ncbi:MAG: hypothetical protein IIT94_11125, partial [Prevotella sp.]|nr:hypothetical protein [Prevotella sp.]
HKAAKREFVASQNDISVFKEGQRVHELLIIFASKSQLSPLLLSQFHKRFPIYCGKDVISCCFFVLLHQEFNE